MRKRSDIGFKLFSVYKQVVYKLVAGDAMETQYVGTSGRHAIERGRVVNTG